MGEYHSEEKQGHVLEPFHGILRNLPRVIGDL